MPCPCTAQGQRQRYTWTKTKGRRYLQDKDWPARRTVEAMLDGYSSGQARPAFPQPAALLNQQLLHDALVGEHPVQGIAQHLGEQLVVGPFVG